jgi:hypothetical protein
VLLASGGDEQSAERRRFELTLRGSGVSAKLRF